MIHRPNPNTAAPTMLSFLLLLLGIVGYIAGASVQRFSWIFQFICLAGITASLYVLIRWRMTWFVFSVGPRDHRDVPTGWENEAARCPADGNGELAMAGNPYRFIPLEQLDLIVVKGQGRRPGVMECVLGMDSLVQAWPVCRRDAGDQVVDQMLPRYQPQKIRAQYPGVKLYEYTQTFQWEEAIAAVFRDGDGYVALLLDIPPNTPLGRYLLGAARPDIFTPGRD